MHSIPYLQREPNRRRYTNQRPQQAHDEPSLVQWMARIQIRIGGVAFNPLRGSYHTDVPVAGVTGGMLLEAPVVGTLYGTR